MIREVVKATLVSHAPEDSVIYKVTRGDGTCDKALYGYTSRGLETSLGGHLRGFEKDDQQNPFLQHVWVTDHPLVRGR